MAAYDMDFLGRDPMYPNMYPGMNPLWGVGIGAGGATAMAEGLQWLAGDTKWGDYSHAIGAGAGVLAGVALYFTGNRSAGIAAAVSAALTHGVMAAIDLFLPTTKEAMAALAGAAVHQLSGGDVEILNGMLEANQLSGIPTAHQLGASNVEILSGALSPMGGLANHFGSTPLG